MRQLLLILVGVLWLCDLCAMSGSDEGGAGVCEATLCPCDCGNEESDKETDEESNERVSVDPLVVSFFAEIDGIMDRLVDRGERLSNDQMRMFASVLQTTIQLGLYEGQFSRFPNGYLEMFARLIFLSKSENEELKKYGVTLLIDFLERCSDFSWVEMRDLISMLDVIKDVSLNIRESVRMVGIRLMTFLISDSKVFRIIEEKAGKGKKKKTLARLLINQINRLTIRGKLFYFSKDVLRIASSDNAFKQRISFLLLSVLLIDCNLASNIGFKDKYTLLEILKQVLMSGHKRSQEYAVFLLGYLFEFDALYITTLTGEERSEFLRQVRENLKNRAPSNYHKVELRNYVYKRILDANKN